MIKKITGVILAGGKSLRMKKDKAFLLINNYPLIEIIIHKLKSVFKEVLIITNSPEKYTYFNIKTIKDIIPDKGPLSGIYTALKFSSTFYTFVVACDMPLISTEIIKYLIEKRDGYDIVIPFINDKYEPLFAIYSKNCIKSIEEHIYENNLKIKNILVKNKTLVVHPSELLNFDPQRLTFYNINTPDNYSRIHKLLGNNCL